MLYKISKKHNILWRVVYNILNNILRIISHKVYCCYMEGDTYIGDNSEFGHFYGVTLGAESIGKNCVIGQLVTIGGGT